MESISKTKLAEMYGWNIRYLARMLNTPSELWEKLTAVGYDNNQKIFTPKQLEIIYNHFGHPQKPL